MLGLITGGSGSGKSAFAESFVCRRGNSRRFYIATMQRFDGETERRIARHRAMRAGKGFETLECPVHLEMLRIPEGKPGVCLLECMSNLVANELFAPDGFGLSQGREAICDHLLKGILAVYRQCEDLIIVTNEVFSDGVFYPPETRTYQAVLGEVNCRLASLADVCYEVVYGIPCMLSGMQCQPIPKEVLVWDDGRLGGTQV